MCSVHPEPDSACAPPPLLRVTSIYLSFGGPVRGKREARGAQVGETGQVERGRELVGVRERQQAQDLSSRSCNLRRLRHSDDRRQRRCGYPLPLAVFFFLFSFFLFFEAHTLGRGSSPWSQGSSVPHEKNVDRRRYQGRQTNFDKYQRAGVGITSAI